MSRQVVCQMRVVKSHNTAVVLADTPGRDLISTECRNIMSHNDFKNTCFKDNTLSDPTVSAR